MARRDEPDPIETLGENLIRESLAATDYTPIVASFCDRLAAGSGKRIVQLQVQRRPSPCASSLVLLAHFCDLLNRKEDARAKDDEVQKWEVHFSHCDTPSLNVVSPDGDKYGPGLDAGCAQRCRTGLDAPYGDVPGWSKGRCVVGCMELASLWPGCETLRAILDYGPTGHWRYAEPGFQDGWQGTHHDRSE